jgi:glycosyltransferase involved in cell wall biosynthesis
MFKIIATVRTLNEERNIQRFCEGYIPWVDKILVADGGSTDRTVEIAKSLPRVNVKHFPKRVEMENGLWRNPEAEHINFLNNWAIDEGADWIIFDDCDSFPNRELKKDAWKIVENSPFHYIYAVRLYLWGEDKFFPELSQPEKVGVWEAGLWAWSRWSRIKFHNTRMAFDFSYKPERWDRLDILLPKCLLHNPWPDEETVEKKLNFYHRSGQIRNIQHPLEYAGVPEELPEWAYE